MSRPKHPPPPTIQLASLRDVPDCDKPRHFRVSSVDYLTLCQGADRNLVTIHTVAPVKMGGWEVSVSWPMQHFTQPALPV